MNNHDYNPNSNYIPPKDFDYQTGELNDDQEKSFENPHPFWYSRASIIIFVLIYLILCGIIIGRLIDALHWSNNLIEERFFEEQLEWIIFPLPFFIVGFILTLFNWMKPAFVAFILTLLFAIIGVNFSAVLFSGICVFLSYKVNKIKEKEKRLKSSKTHTTKLKHIVINGKDSDFPEDNLDEPNQ